MDGGQLVKLSRRERLLLLAVGVTLVAVVAITVGRLAGPRGDIIRPVANRPTPGPSVALPISVVDAYRLADSWARQWNDDAELILVSARVDIEPASDWSTPAVDGGMIIFSFAAPESDNSWPRASVAVSRQTGTIFFDETTEFAVEPPPDIGPRLLALPISAEQAFRMADAVVGREYRSGCEAYRREVAVDLDTTDPASTSWVIVYYDMRHRQRNDIIVRIDAQTGDLSRDVRHDPSCATASPAVFTDKPAV